MQGCPLAALLFVIAMEPFCILFTRQLESLDLGRVRLCADDIGVVLKSWRSLVVLFHIFKLAEQCASLRLNLKKCFLVPISAPLSPHVISTLRDFLVSRITPWADFNITACAEYLGIWLGPAASTRQWTSQNSKFLSKVRDISDAQVAPSLAVKAYNSKTATVLSYPSQFLPPPPAMQKLEKYAFTKIYKVPYNTLAHNEQFAVSGLGIGAMKSLDIAFTAAK
eukprot:1253076-Karenia_brevis.AAC.1